MSARSGLVANKSSWPHVVPFQANFSMGQKMKNQISKYKSVSRKMLARSGLVGNESSWPHVVPFQAIFPWAGNMQKILSFVYFPWWAHGPYSPGLGPFTNSPLSTAPQPTMGADARGGRYARASSTKIGMWVWKVPTSGTRMTPAHGSKPGE